MRDIQACHTPAAGSALWRCPRCGGRHFTFVGCGNRHCPGCGSAAAERWRHKHAGLLLPTVVYHLVTFTVPEALRRPIRSHPRELLELLMSLSASTLLDACANPQFLGATPGLTAVLHTWTRQYEYHPRVHFIATGGEHALGYLARYVQRVALCEGAILGHDPDRITLRYRKSGTNEPSPPMKPSVDLKSCTDRNLCQLSCP